MTAIMSVWTESSWAFPKSYTADDSWIVRTSDGGQQGDKRPHNSTTKVSFCTSIISFCHQCLKYGGISAQMGSDKLNVGSDKTHVGQ